MQNWRRARQRQRRSSAAIGTSAALGGVVRIFGLILAGGTARRMGGVNKALLSLGGQTLLSHAISRLEPQVERLAISANTDAEILAGYGLPILRDETPMGPLAGILAALRWAAPLGATAVVSVAVDTPFFPPDLVPQLCLAAETTSSGLAVAHGSKDHPAFGIWPIALIPSLTAFLNSGVNPRVLTFVDAQCAARARFRDDRAFDNLNTPEDLAQAAALFAGQP